MNKKISNEKIKDIILGFETQWPVDLWNVNGVHVWPYIRNRIYIFLLNYEDDNIHVETSISEINIKRKKKYLFKLKRLFKSIYVIKALVSLVWFFNNLKSKRIVFFGSSFHRVLRKGKFYNRFFDSIIEYNHLEEEVYLMESQNVYDNIYNKKAIIDLKKNLDNYKLLLKLKSIFYRKKIDSSLVGYEDFYNRITESFLKPKGLEISKDEIKSWGFKVYSVKQFYIKFYKKVKPERTIFLSYNGYDDLYAAILAANYLKIKTIDFQHGFQTNLHMVYSHWIKIPEGSFNIMPTEYWTWDELSKNNIDDWAGSLNEISAKVVGHPYLRLCLEEANIENHSDKILFYSLGVDGLNEMFPRALVKVIKGTSHNWIFRMHPRSRFLTSDIVSLMNSYKVNEKKYIIQNAFDVPLPNTLANSILHITNYSGCLLEARMMGIPSVIISKAGLDYFKKYIDNYLVYYLHREKENFGKEFEKILVEVSSNKYKPKVGEIVNPFFV